MLSLEQATQLVAGAAEPLPEERVPLEEALNRIASEPSTSKVDLPPFDRSAMDGFAVRAQETVDLQPLKIVGDVPAGISDLPVLQAQTTLRISTGAPIPPGANAVLQSELANVSAMALTPQEVIPEGRHIRFSGEDIRAGDPLLLPGNRVTIQKVSGLASAGVGEVSVHRRPRVHLFVTGSELIPIGSPAEAGKIHNSNGLTIRKLAEYAGADVTDAGVVPDDEQATNNAVEEGLAANVLLVSGGVSVGDHDHVRPALKRAGVEEIFWRVNIKPGKPIWFGRKGKTLVFGLPGNPLSALVGFKLFVEPTLQRLQGATNPGAEVQKGVLDAPAEGDTVRTTFILARSSSTRAAPLRVAPMQKQGSHFTGALASADGFIILPPGSKAAAGDEIDFLKL